MSDTFESFPRIPRLSRECIVTEKIDGTNAQIFVLDTLFQGSEFIPLRRVDLPEKTFWIAAGSRNRWITPEADNYGFAKWVYENASELVKLGPGRHFGEWWGLGIQRGYGLQEKRFSLFNVHRWIDEKNSGFSLGSGIAKPPPCCSVVPVLHQGEFDTNVINSCLTSLQERGSYAAPGFTNPEGVVIYHTASKQLFKKTLEGDGGKHTLQKQQ